MLLALDVGNTNIVIGFLDESGIRNIARLETDRDKTAHEYAISLRQVIEFSGIAPEDIDGAILSSVVPPINGALIAAVRMIAGIRPLVVGPGMKTGLNIALDNPATMGSDLVVGAAAALAIHDPPLIIIDMGTATTMTVIDREARVLGGAIIPGVGISLEALANGTSQLPHISLDAPKKCISTDTVEAMRSGSVYGTAAMLDGMIERMEAELGEPAAVIATGGLGGCIIPYCRREITYDKNLLLNGLWALYQKNKRKRYVRAPTRRRHGAVSVTPLLFSSRGAPQENRPECPLTVSGISDMIER